MLDFLVASCFHARPRLSLILESITSSISRRRSTRANFFVAGPFYATFGPFKRFPTLKSSANVAGVRCAVILEMCARGLVKNGLFEKSCATVPTIFRVITQLPQVTLLLLSVYGIIPDRWMAISYQFKKYTFSSSLY